MNSEARADIVQRLDDSLGMAFVHIMQGDRLKKALVPGFADKRLYAQYLIQTYYYTWHNPRHQALVATRPEKIPVRYAQYCLRHAAEEFGHEMMAYHDLLKIGFTGDQTLWPAPLPETTDLINYLYKVSSSGSPYARLGYTFWAERCYGFINSAIKEMARSLELGDSAMTFLVAHSQIDEKHAKDVEAVIREFVQTNEDEAAVNEVMNESLRLTIKMMDAVFDNFVKLKNSANDSSIGDSSQDGFKGTWIEAR